MVVECGFISDRMELGAQIHGFIISCFIIYIVIKILGEEEEAVELYLTAI